MNIPIYEDEAYNGDTLSKSAVPVLILRILKKITDENHILNATEIGAILKNTYELEVDRRTIYNAVNTLVSLGYEISDFNDNGKGYYLCERQFEPNEIELLLSAVNAFPFISENQTKDLMEKLQSDSSDYEKKSVGNLMIIHPENKALNKSIFTNISRICEAIESKKKISFTYLEYGTDLKLHPKREKKFTVNPYGLVYNNENLYLACTYAGHDNACLYRMDMIKDIDIRDYPIEEPLSRTSLRKEMADMVYAHPGESLSFTVRCEKKYLRDVIDEFGSNIIVVDEGDYIRATVHATKIGMTYWCLQYLQHVEVISPDDFRQEIIDLLKNNVYTQ